MRLVLFTAGWLVLGAIPQKGFAQEILLTPAKAVREIFPEAMRTSVETRTLSPESLKQISRQLGRQISDEPREVIRLWDAAGKFLGYAVITEEIGKYRPITFMVGVTPQISVRDVAVLVYRESRGGDIKRKRFLSQYRGKTTRNPIDSNRDIINISGATISVRSMNAGVKRVLAELNALYGSTATQTR